VSLDLRSICSNPLTHKTLLDKLAEAGFGKGELSVLQQLIDAEKSDLYDVFGIRFQQQHYAYNLTSTGSSR